MKKFYIELEETIKYCFEIEAESEDEAKQDIYAGLVDYTQDENISDIDTDIVYCEEVR